MNKCDLLNKNLNDFFKREGRESNIDNTKSDSFCQLFNEECDSPKEGVCIGYHHDIKDSWEKDNDK
jgi:hypothetical protein